MHGSSLIMKKQFTPVSRLSFIFLLAIIIPGVILTYFGTLYIKNLKEMTEQTVFDEEKQLVEIITDSIRYKLINTTEFADRILNDTNEDIFSKCDAIEKNQFIDNCFILNKKGEFIFPFFIEPSSTIFKTDFHRAFDELYRSAENAEFREKDLANAEKLYSGLLPQVMQPSDSAKILNSLARVTFKNKKYDNAVEYSSILLKYSDKLDQNGFPYINYVIHRMLDLYVKTGDLKIINMLGEYIDKMLDGEIPLTTNTIDLLNKFNIVMTDLDETKSTEKSTVIWKIELLRNRLLFVESYKSAIEELIINNNLSIITVLNDYFAVLSHDDESIIIIKDDKNSDVGWMGFIVNQENFQKSVINNIKTDILNFKYIVNVYDDYTSTSPLKEKYVLSSKLYPFPSDQILVVGLEEPERIFARILKETWLYGFALIALIGAMVFGVVLVIRDFNRERQLSQLRSDFVSSITHDLKTPITSIQLFAESILMNRVKNANDIKEYSQIIINETTRLKRLINNVLDFSKIDNKNLELRLQRTDISKVFNDIIKELDYWIKEKNFKINQQIKKGVYANIDIDAFTQVIINLISNAIKHSEKLREIWAYVRQDEKHIIIEIKDKGVGIPLDQQEHIFDKFYKIDSSSTGAGLGLFITKQIVEAHGGTISVNSEPGKGSIFTIILKRR